MDINSQSTTQLITNRLSDSTQNTVAKKINPNSSTISKNTREEFKPSINNVSKRQDIAQQNKLLLDQRQQSATLKQANEVIVQLKQQPQQLDRSLEFKIDEASGKTIITVKDRSTGEVLKQIPSEEIIQLGIRLKELADSLQSSNNELSGLFLKRQV